MYAFYTVCLLIGGEADAVHLSSKLIFKIKYKLSSHTWEDLDRVALWYFYFMLYHYQKLRCTGSAVSIVKIEFYTFNGTKLCRHN